MTSSNVNSKSKTKLQVDERVIREFNQLVTGTKTGERFYALVREWSADFPPEYSAPIPGKTITPGNSQLDAGLIQKLNGAQNKRFARYSICAAVNQIINDPDEKISREKADVGQFYALFADFDETEPNLEDFEIEPSIIVGTSKHEDGWRKQHWYWLIEGNMDLAVYEAIQGGLVGKFGADKNARDIARILRLPGTYHLKDPTNPQLVEIIGGTSKRYSVKDLDEAFEGTASIGAKQSKSRKTPANTSRKPTGASGAANAIAGRIWWDLPLEAVCERICEINDYADATQFSQQEWRLIQGGSFHIETHGADEGLQLWIDHSETDPDRFDEDANITSWKSWDKNGHGDNPYTMASYIKLVKDQYKERTGKRLIFS
ncbi:MAG: hypothetical protein AAFV59_15500, partial [Pseudomonadota bacterium]